MVEGNENKSSMGMISNESNDYNNGPIIINKGENKMNET
jgi:hypothetical protein